MHALCAAALVFAGPESVSECLERAESMSGVLGSGTATIHRNLLADRVHIDSVVNSNIDTVFEMSADERISSCSCSGKC